MRNYNFPEVKRMTSRLDKGEFLEDLLFEGIYETSKRLFGEEATRQLLFLSVREAVKAMISSKGIEKELKNLNQCDLIKLIFNTFGVTEVECSKGGSKVIVRNCPLPDRHDPHKEGKACIVMMAILAGATEVLSNSRITIETPVTKFGSYKPDIVIKMKKSKVLGDCCCEFDIFNDRDSKPRSN